MSVLLLLALAQGAWAQSGAAGEYRAYPLKYKAAADVERVLAEMLAGMGDSTHLVVDSKANQLLLRGPDGAQQVARQLIESIDRPAPDRRPPARPPEKPPDAKLLLRSYPCAPGEEKQTASGLRSRFSDRADVRVATDPQSGLVWVLAPAGVHDELSLRSSGPPPAFGEARRPSRLETDPEPAGQFVGLSRTRIDQIETSLRELLGARLVPLSGRRIGRSEYRFADASGRQVELVLDGSRRGVTVYGGGPLAEQFVRLIRHLDAPAESQGRSVQLVPLRRADPAKVRQAVEAYRGNFRRENLPAPGADGVDDGDEGPLPRSGPRENQQGARVHRNGVKLVSYLFQQEDEEPAAATVRKTKPAAEEKPGARLQPGLERLRQLRRELTGEVEIETLPDLDVIILRGRRRDVEEVRKIVEEIERLSAETQPAIDIYQLRYVSGDALLEVIRQVEAVYLTGRQGRLAIVPLFKPNALMLIGWGDVVRAAKELIARLDQPVDPTTQQRTYPLRYASAATLQPTLMEFFASRTGGLSPRLHISLDARTNALIVHGPPGDLAELELLLEKLDVAGTRAVLQTRIFRLENTLATDLYATLQAAINAARGGAAGAAAQKSAALEFLTRDPKGEKLIKSGILGDVQIAPDPRLNVLIVAAPAESMDLVAALIRELDSPGLVAQIKVFKLTNADATAMVTTLRSLLPADVTTAGPQVSAGVGEPAMVGLRFSVDQRTNSIVAVGSAGVLRIVEALLLRLDTQDVQQRKTTVYRLKNAPATDVANAINLFLRSERQLQMAAPGALSPFQQIEREVVVVPEPVSNALILSTTPRYFEEIQQLVEKLDAQPAQVMIQVLIAEVTLRDTDEFGVELGLQDAILFNRSVLAGNLAPRTTSTQQSTPSGIITQTETDFPAATLDPGFLFNSKDLGNSASTRVTQNSKRLGDQALTNLNVGRINNELGFGGLVLSASSESVSVLIRALQESQRLEVLGRPQIRTLDNQPAFIQIGARVPRITGTSVSPTIGQVNQLVLENVGLILGVTPRISPDGKVVMEIDAERSELGPESEGIPVSIIENSVIRSPKINTTMAQATVSAADGETIVLGGLITKNNTTIQRKVPYLADIPLFGELFKYHSQQMRRTELLIVLTPRVVNGPEDEERMKRIESSRMHWCLDDVRQIFGDDGLTQAGGSPDVVYPHTNPRGKPSGKAANGERWRGNGTRPEMPPLPSPPPAPATPAPDGSPGAYRDTSPADESRRGPVFPNPLRGPEGPEAAAQRIESAPPPGSSVPAVYQQATRARE
jgi:general secretion pathway protein D